MAKCMPESNETPAMEAKAHQPSFLKKAGKMAMAKKSEHDGKKPSKKPARKRG